MICRDYICAMCFAEVRTDNLFPKHCGHYMPQKEEYLQHVEIWLAARDYEFSKQEPNGSDEHSA